MNVSTSRPIPPFPINPTPTESCMYLDATGRLDNITRARQTTYSCISSASWVPRALFTLSIPERRKLTRAEQQYYREKVEKSLINLRVNPSSTVFRRLVEDGKLHMDVRLQLLGSQLLLLYKTGFSCSTQESKRRICHRLPKREGNDATRSYFEAAHCHLLPELRVRIGQGKSYSIPPDSWLYLAWNTTTLLPTIWNQADTMVDGQNSNPDSLRCEILRVFNRAAQLNTRKNSEEYYHEVIKKIVERVREYLRLNPSNTYTLPLRCYMEVLNDYQHQIDDRVNMLAWVCMERSLETEQEVRVVQKRIWNMTQIGIVINKEQSFATHKEQFKLIKPKDLKKVLVPQIQTQIPTITARSPSPLPIRRSSLPVPIHRRVTVPIRPVPVPVPIRPVTVSVQPTPTPIRKT